MLREAEGRVWWMLTTLTDQIPVSYTHLDVYKRQVQAWRKVDFGTGTVTFLDDTQKEDMLQVEYPNGFLLDMGWYQDRYICLLYTSRCV